MEPHETHVLVGSVAWTLIHFLWQGALIAVVLWLLLAIMEKSSARRRYAVRCAALVLMACAPLATFVWLKSVAPLQQAVAASSARLPLTPASVLEDAAGYGYMAWVTGLWCLGVVLCTLRLAGGLVQVARLRQRVSDAQLEPHWQRRFERLARQFGVRARARIVNCASVCVPTVIGFAKPIVLLPARLFSGLTDEQIEALLAHELAHIARNDYLVNIAQSIVESLFFYHPAVWWVSRGIRVEREYCCDDLAVAATQNGLVYAHALTALESWRGAQPQLGVSTLGGSLMSRIQRLVGTQPASSSMAPRPAHAAVSLVAILSLSASALANSTFPESTPCDCTCHHQDSGSRGPITLEVDGTASEIVEVRGTVLRQPPTIQMVRGTVKVDTIVEVEQPRRVVIRLESGPGQELRGVIVEASDLESSVSTELPGTVGLLLAPAGGVVSAPQSGVLLEVESVLNRRTGFLKLRARELLEGRVRNLKLSDGARHRYEVLRNFEVELGKVKGNLQVEATTGKPPFMKAGTERTPPKLQSLERKISDLQERLERLENDLRVARDAAVRGSFPGSQ